MWFSSRESGSVGPEWHEEAGRLVNCHGSVETIEYRVDIC